MYVVHVKVLTSVDDITSLVVATDIRPVAIVVCSVTEITSSKSVHEVTVDPALNVTVNDAMTVMKVSAAQWHTQANTLKRNDPTVETWKQSTPTMTITTHVERNSERTDATDGGVEFGQPSGRTPCPQ